jgi:hypothetical protein
VRFYFDGERLQDTDTPAKLELQDDDLIDVQGEVDGGSC